MCNNKSIATDVVRLDSAMFAPRKPLILGSGSPRREQILDTIGIPLIIVPAQIDETPYENESPEAYLHRIVLEKLNDVSSRIVSQNIDIQSFRGVVVADTIVVYDNQIIGKPTSDTDAHQILRHLSGRRHQVLTRFAISAPENTSTPVHQETVQTDVYFRELTDTEIARYVATGEGKDKAGAYAIQGAGAFAVARIEGSYNNAVGLPANEVQKALIRVGIIKLHSQ